MLPAGVVVVLAAVCWGGAPVWLAAIAGLVAQPALLVYEFLFVRAGQDVPLS